MNWFDWFKLKTGLQTIVMSDLKIIILNYIRAISWQRYILEQSMQFYFQHSVKTLFLFQSK